MTPSPTTIPIVTAPRWRGLVAVLALLAAELALVHTLRHLMGFECVPRAGYGFCRAARDILLMSYGAAAGLVLLTVFARDAIARLLSEAGIRRVPFLWNAGGLAVLAASLPLLRVEMPAAAAGLLALVWTGAILATAGGALVMLAPAERWRRLWADLGWGLPLVLGASIAAPLLARAVRPFWQVETLSDWTFQLVVRLMEFWGTAVETRPGTKIIGAGDFFINVAPSCSGVEGLVLTTVFASIYLVLFRQDLRFPQALLILPVALLISWLLNAVRIAVLLQIGLAGRPDLAVGGFHSHAGWLMFTLLSLGIVLVTQGLGLFRETDATETAPAPLPPFFQDPVVARILPFAVFMASALLASTFTTTPGLVYPLRALLMAGVLALVWRHIAALPWRIDAFSIGAGLVIALYWVLTGPPPAADPAMEGLTGIAFAVWLVARVAGTTFLVPVIEELFFRGYLLARLSPAGASRWRLIFGVLFTSVLFAALHDRWIAAFVAGLIFAGLTLRSRNLTDAILAHAIANFMIALWAIKTGNWAVI